MEAPALCRQYSDMALFVPAIMYILFGLLTAAFLISATVVDIGCVTTVVTCLVIIFGSLVAWPLMWLVYLLTETT